MRSGWYLALAAVAAAVIGWGVFRLSGSPLVSGGRDSAGQPTSSEGSSDGGHTTTPNPAIKG